MGMFDNISCADALPYSEEMVALGLNVNNRSFQTKDLNNYLADYTIQGGKLYIKKYKTQKWIEGNSESNNPFEQIGYMKQEEPYLEQVLHHGEIFFYDYVDDVQDKWDCWVEFKAVFTNGTVERYELVKFEKTDNADRKAREKVFFERYRQEENAWYNKYFLRTSPVRYVRRKLSRALYDTGTFISSLSHKL